MNGIAYVNGVWLPLAEAKVPVLDRGFLFADGVYEVIAAYGGKPFALREHLARLQRSLAELRIPNPHDETQWTALVERLIAENAPEAGDGDTLVYLQVTRGAPASRAHAFPENCAPGVVGMSQTLSTPGTEALSRGVAAVTRLDIRWGRCDIKSIALLPNVLATQGAREQHCNEAILHREGRVTEGASSNVFAVLGNTVVTPSKGPEILTGITRDLLIELLHKARIPLRERRLTLTELRSAEEIWLTSTTREVLPVTHLDGEPVHAGKPGPLWKKAYDLFQARKRQ